MIDEFLAVEFAPDMPLARLFARYQTPGEVPIIFRDGDDKTIHVNAYNHFEYALARRGSGTFPARASELNRPPSSYGATRLTAVV